MTLTITDAEHQELMRIKRRHDKLVPLFQFNINKMKEELAELESLEPPTDGLSGWMLITKCRLKQKIEDFEELLK